MEWLLHNEIADLRGPDFLLLYGIFIAFLLVFCWWQIGKADQSGTLMPLPLPSQPDPYEIAYLRQGEQEVYNLILLRLVQHNYIEVSKDAEPIIDQSRSHPDPKLLSPVERLVWDIFKTPMTARRGFPLINDQIKNFCVPYAGRAMQEQLLLSPEVKKSTRKMKLLAMTAIILLGAYKFIVALAKGRYNVMFLLLMGLFGVLLLAKIGPPKRLTRRGRDYLKRLQSTFKPADVSNSASSGKGDREIFILAGLFGMGVLTGTLYQNFLPIFSLGNAATGSDSIGGYTSIDSGGCSSNSSDGGGCSSGGGGCGGCGGGGD
jgi:uncharacterized protein (TIGR04222 family)